MDFEIKNISDLRARIISLEIKKQEDEIYFNQKFTSIKSKLLSPFSFVKNLFTGKNTSSNPLSEPLKSDYITYLGRVLLPMLLNRTVLRNKGFILKTIVSFLTQKTINSTFFNKEVLSSWVDKATIFVRSKTKKEKRYGHDDYGIPPESETA